MGRIIKYGWKADIPDQRDLLFRHRPPSAVKIPDSVDLRKGCAPIEDQGQIGSCTAFGTIALLEFIEKISDKTPTNLSHRHLYYTTRAFENTLPEDSGAMIRDVIKVLASDGVSTERTCPYIVSKFNLRPSPKAYAEAPHHRAGVYRRIQTRDEMLQCLAEGFPFTFGFTVYESFESNAVAGTGIVSLPGRNERTLGGHCVDAVGYDLKGDWAWCRNSWSSHWGIKGYFKMPLAYLTNRELSDDFWTIRSIAA